VVSGTGSSISAPITGAGTIFVVATNSTTTCSRNMNGSASVFPQAATIWYIDSDGDGYGNAATSIQACTQPIGYVSNNTDCNDGNNAVKPGATEICNGIDDNCAGGIDEGFDADGDGFTSCGGDCNDNNSSINPEASEVCSNFTDDNCSGVVNEGCCNVTLSAVSTSTSCAAVSNGSINLTVNGSCCST
jgi:hypothetical protein